MNSTSEAGGTAPFWSHVTCPDPHSVVAQLNLPESAEHPVLAQKRPDHGAVTSRELVACGANSNPVEDS